MSIHDIFNRKPAKLPKSARKARQKTVMSPTLKVAKRVRDYGKNRIKTMTIRMMPTEHDVMSQVAKICGMNVSTFARACAVAGSLGVLKGMEEHRGYLEEVSKELEEAGAGEPWAEILPAAEVCAVWNRSSVRELRDLRAVSESVNEGEDGDRDSGVES